MPDPEQESVISAACDARLQVIAPPGHGKTWVLQQRVAKLVRDGIDPTRILVISLTRVAVHEVRSRIASLDAGGSSCTGVTIRTLHSFAGRLLWELGDGAASYEDTIGRLSKRIEKKDPQALEKIGQYRHVLIDEAQDLIGTKAILALQLLGAAAPGVGWTVFADPHQAIYDFEEGAGKAVNSFCDRFARQFPRVRRIELQNYYRSANPKVRLLLTAARMLLDENGPDLVQQMFSLTTRAAEQGFIPSTEFLEDSEASAGDALILHRGRAGTLKTSYHLREAGHQHRMRMGGLARVVPAWVALTLNLAVDRTGEKRLKRADFSSAFDEVTEQNPAARTTLSAADAWSTLLRVTGAPAAKFLEVERVAEAILRGAADDAGFGHEPGAIGPVVGTVHGSKGREARSVLLYLPDAFLQKKIMESNDPAEARALYVGMSRAMGELVVSKGANTAKYEKSKRESSPRRFFSGVGPELGLREDVDPLGTIVRGGAAGQALLATYEGGRYRTISAILSGNNLDFREGKTIVAAASASCVSELKFHLYRPARETELEKITVHDVGTAALPREGLSKVPEPWATTRLVLVPVLTGTAFWSRE